MGDIAEYLMDRAMDIDGAFFDSRQHRVTVKKYIKCKFCGERNLSWFFSEGKWRLKNMDDEKHSCLKVSHENS